MTKATIPYSNGNRLPSLLQPLVAMIYLTLVGRQGLGLSWGGAIGRSLLMGLLGGMINYALNYLAFVWYVWH